MSDDKKLPENYVFIDSPPMNGKIKSLTSFQTKQITNTSREQPATYKVYYGQIKWRY